MTHRLLTALLAVLLTAAATAQDKKDQDTFRKCSAASGAKAIRTCQAYLAQQPAGAFRQDAVKALWTAIEGAGEEPDWQRFLNDYPGVPDAKSAKEGYLRRFPDGPLAADLSWAATEAAGDEASYGRFAVRFPASPHAAEAVQKLRDRWLRARLTVALEIMRDLDRQADARKVAQLGLLAPDAPRLAEWREKARQAAGKSRSGSVSPGEKRIAEAFEKLDAGQLEDCDRFLRQISHLSDKPEIVRETLFRVAVAAGADPAKAESVPELVRWLPISKSAAFYSTAWNRLQAAAAGKTSEEQLAALRPWILARTYQFAAPEERIFLGDILAEAAVLHMRLKQPDEAGMAWMSAAAVLLPTISDPLNYFFQAPGDQNAKMAWVRAAVGRLSEVERMLVTAGGQIPVPERDTLGSVATTQAEDQAADPDRLRRMLEEAAGNRLPNPNQSETMAAGHQCLRRALDDAPDNWAALYGLILYPDVAALEPVALMPRFYDYVDALETFLGKFKIESIALANRWLADPAATRDRKARALFILAHFQVGATPPAAVDAADLGDQAFFRDYYRARQGDGEAPGRLAAEAAKNNPSALVLYLRVRGKTPTPQALSAWLREKIGGKYFADNEDLGSLTPLVNAMGEDDRNKTTAAMLDSYDLAWNREGAERFAATLPSSPGRDEVAAIMQGANPWKKVALVKVLVKGKSQPEVIRRYLAGEYYSKGDSAFVRRNGENLLTRSVVLPPGTYINPVALNRAIDDFESRYKSMLIQSALHGLAAIPTAEAVGVIRERFLTDDRLCVVGAAWLLAQAEAAKAAGFDAARIPESGVGVRGAVRQLLIARFSTAPDYGPFLATLAPHAQEPEWAMLLILASLVAPGKVALPREAERKLADPTGDATLEKLLDNTKLRIAELTEMGRTRRAD